ncbi:uncharacterized protein LACBIDRAFT_328890 [Laccaria bicolor S238N-H82]|uniref:Predicted protein n=1 Tax=Laccaria bicolor (strain S238N-H82 / ATCC MYA-4686) TaxID=486041 RepID=B0DGB6_LACBS|nr:uncharacterized protein LACBIDRAFT_328890 [Laccaria bicolor S238N-H82]EDR06123.1 predicted protein [Laccaria bicolor S238N-H82]|eukprot:XP_001882984.1 predicted protein [Laccaria bicolor S238N-H82]
MTGPGTLPHRQLDPRLVAALSGFALCYTSWPHPSMLVTKIEKFVCTGKSARPSGALSEGVTVTMSRSTQSSLYEPCDLETHWPLSDWATDYMGASAASMEHASGWTRYQLGRGRSGYLSRPGLGTHFVIESVWISVYGDPWIRDEVEFCSDDSFSPEMVDNLIHGATSHLV